jgi:methylthioribose-1-phosphate isomerase
MKVKGKEYRTIWIEKSTVFMINQLSLPFRFEIYESKTYLETCDAIKNMIVRGAGAIGAAAGFAMVQAFYEARYKNPKGFLEKARKHIEGTRPTARDLFYAVEKVYQAGIRELPDRKKALEVVEMEARTLAMENEMNAYSMGKIGASLISDGMRILTHCNAGWLGFVNMGSALAPVYFAHWAGKRVHVYVSETRPRGQGARLTAWELHNEGVAHTIVADTATAYLMAKGRIDLVITGADRIAANGDTANKLGTLEKAILAKEYNIPFYIAAPISTIDLECPSGEHIIIEERDEKEVLFQTGLTNDGRMETIRVCSPGSHALNPAFDVTPAKYITGIITEKGIIKAEARAILKLY